MRLVLVIKKIKHNLGIPEDYLVIGSFQKDGEGWGEGLKPKLIKGPDIFIETIKLIKQKRSKFLYYYWVLLEVL